MSSNPSAINKLALIEQDLNLNGLQHAAGQLAAFLKEYDNSDEVCNDKIQNLTLQILIGQGRFEELEQVVENFEPASPESDIRRLIAKGILANRALDYRKSLVYFLDAEAKATLNGNSRLIAQVLINIGTVYAGLHHYQEGLGRYADVLDKYSNILSKTTQAALLHNLGNLNYAIGEINESIRCLKESIALDNPATIERSHLLLNRSYLSKTEQPDLKRPEVNEDHDLYPIYLYCQSFDQEGSTQLLTLRKVADLARNGNDFKTELDALQRIVEIHKISSNFEMAYSALENYRSVEQALLSVQQSAKLAEQAARYEIAEKEQSIKVLQKEKELQGEIVKRNDMLEAVNEELRQFAYVVSHDLKEPLRMIGSYTQLIEMGFKDRIDPDSKEYFSYVSGGVTRLNVLLDGLSNYSTLKSLQEDHEAQSLRDIIQTAIENLDVLIKETNTTLSLNVDVELNGSPALLVLLFQNLIQNAIKFRKRETIAEVHITANKTKEKTTIEISDNGLGIAANQRERIFVIFQRLSRDHSEGSGMGLAICKKIVQLHEGRIYVKEASSLGGTTFCIDLPN